MRNRSRTASFRRSVISVAAAFVAAPGCGSDSHDKTIDQINPPACDEGSMPTGCAHPVECTDTPPEQGARCSEDGASCDYDSCSNAGNIGSAVCTDGKWELVEVSCNPPPISFECPAEAPRDGDACDDTSGTVCTYDCEGADAHVEATCVAGSWSIDEGEGCVVDPRPQPEECPEVPPEDHTPCNTPSGIDCFYGECNGKPQIEVSCISQEVYEKGPTADLWFVFDKGCRPPPMCPDEPPAVGSECPQHGDSCRYNIDPQDCPENGWNFEITCVESGWVDSHESHFCETPGGEKG